MTLQEIEALKQAMASTDNKRLYERYLAVSLHLEGRSPTEIAKLLERDRRTIRSYLSTYGENGIDGLKKEYYTGIPYKLTYSQEEELKQLLMHRRPADMGIEERYTWTLQLIIEWIEREYRVKYTKRGLNQTLKRLGFRLTRAVFLLAKSDRKSNIHYQEVSFPELKHILEKVRIHQLHFEDDSQVLAYQILQYGWFLKGTERKKLFTHQEEGQASFPTCIRFLKGILRDHPRGSLFVVLDDSRVEHMSELEPILQKNPRLTLVFLPPYTPDLTATEENP
ncbi:IS630 family transposase [Paenibacillus albidus]|uniref:IS630 family transposase n=1 Tax=Paenibacillus albidus TaxID=2041023 RepID=UPI001BE6C9A9|nr:IS630 family transposase [Paenibacillus albidus]MBT2287729.1 IS630 family transposase [Paenibacillus albidus]